MLNLSIAGCALLALSSPPQDDGPAFENQIPCPPPFSVPESEIEVSLTVPGYDPIAFEATAIAFPGFPQSLLLPATPLGVGALMRFPGQPVGDYVLVFDTGVAPIPLTWDQVLVGSSGSASGVTAEVSPVPVATTAGDDLASQGPQDPPVVEVEKGNPVTNPGGITITAYGTEECTYRWVQFVTPKVTWKGKKGGLDVSGTGAGEDSNKANNGMPMDTDGETVYVDCSNATDPTNPTYTQQITDTADGERTQMLTDVPGLKNPGKLETEIERLNKGVQVGEITLTQYFTDYLYVSCIPMVTEQLFCKVEWSRTQTVVQNQDGSWPTPPEGGYGGPITPWQGPFFSDGKPLITETSWLDPEHAQALNNHGTANPGAQSNGW